MAEIWNKGQNSVGKHTDKYWCAQQLDIFCEISFWGLVYSSDESSHTDVEKAGYSSQIQFG